jgi:hypothetical protein
MEIAYQTPKLSQFHIGFRYERRNHDNTWRKTEFTIKDNLAYFETCLNDGTFRTKSLDHDDIIEAGWEESKTSFTEGRQYYNLGEYQCFLEDDEFFIYYKWSEDGEYLFKGTVKNYNKLIDVMEMLGIN